MTQAPTPKTPAARKADERKRYRALGRVPIEVWVHPADAPRVRVYVTRLNKVAEK